MKACMMKTEANESLQEHNIKAGGSMFKGMLLRRCWGVLIFLLVSSSPVFGRNESDTKKNQAQTEKSSWWSWLGFNGHKKNDAPKIEGPEVGQASEPVMHDAHVPELNDRGERVLPDARTMPVSGTSVEQSVKPAEIKYNNQRHGSVLKSSSNPDTQSTQGLAHAPQSVRRSLDQDGSNNAIKNKPIYVREMPSSSGAYSHDSGSRMIRTSSNVATYRPQVQCQTKYRECEQRSSSRHYTNRGFERTNGDIYLLPNWPFYSQFFQHGDLVQALFTFDTASQAYAGRGGTENLSKLIFGQNPITIQGILLASNLLELGDITSAAPAFAAQVNSGAGVAVGSDANIALTQANHFLGILANQEVKFDASLDQYVGAINYARSFRKGEVTVGFYIPIKMRSQKLRITNDISTTNRDLLLNVQNGPGNQVTVNGVTYTPGNTGTPTPTNTALYFFEQYDNLTDFVDDILSRKGLSFNHKQTILGFTDMTGYITVEFLSRHVERMLVGLSLLIPTASGRDTGKLWYTDLGNGGFVETAAYLSLLWQRNRWFNPYVHVKGTLGLGANVDRRVPKTNTYDGISTFNGIKDAVSGGSTSGLIIFGETLNFSPIQPPPAVPPTSKAFAVDDSSVRQFADQADRVKVTPGPQFFCRLGNTIDAVFGYKGFLDLYYDLQLRGKDYIRRNSPFDPGILTHNTASVSNTLGFNYSYQFDAQYRLRLGASYVFLGRNVGKTLGVDLTLNAEF
jgi:hypothetical protein